MTLSTASRSKLILISLLLAAALLLSVAACAGGGHPSLKGKWEQVSGDTLGAGPGDVWEFYDNGKASVGGMAIEYSWPDNTHLQFGSSSQGGIICEFALDGDSISLTNCPYGSMTLKRYQELSPSAQVIAGTWDLSYPDDSQCFSGLGLSFSPSQFSLGADGSFSLEEAGLLGGGKVLAGQFSFSGAHLLIQAIGTDTSSNLLGLGTTQTEIGGDLDCQVTLTRARLTLTDDQGGQTLYTRTQD